MKNVMEFIGQAHGEAAKFGWISMCISQVAERLGGDCELMQTIIAHDEFSSRECASPVTLASCLEIAFETYGAEIEDSIMKIESISDLRAVYSDVVDGSYCFLAHLETLEQYQERQREEKRKELESFAGSFAHKHGITTNSLEFIQKIHDELQRNEWDHENWNSGERRMEEFAAHRYSGTVHSYFDDLNYVNNQIHGEADTLQGVLDWISESCPLLWAKWEESQLVES